MGNESAAASQTLHFDPLSADRRGSMILRLAALAVFAITLAAIQSTRVSQAITFPTMDLGCVAGCTGDPFRK